MLHVILKLIPCKQVVHCLHILLQRTSCLGSDAIYTPFKGSPIESGRVTHISFRKPVFLVVDGCWA